MADGLRGSIGGGAPGEPEEGRPPHPAGAHEQQAPTAIITGASRGLGLALARRLADDGWRLVIDARDGAALQRAAASLPAAASVRAVPGDVTDPAHRHALVTAAGEAGRVTALVNNASALGPTPLPGLERYPLDRLRAGFEVNVIAPLALAQATLPLLAPGGVIVNVTSDAAREAYPGWGGYGATKAALEQISAVLGVERPDVRVYAVDPGDMATRMHAEADPDADPADLADPGERAAGIRQLLAGDRPSGRYRAADLVPVASRSRA